MTSHQKSRRIKSKQISGEGLTPLTILKRLPGVQKVLLESSEDGERGRYSIVGANPIKSYRGFQGGMEERDYRTGDKSFYEGEVFDLLKRLLPRISGNYPLPFIGGAVGYCTYEAADPDAETKSTEFSSAYYHLYDTIVVYDHFLENVTILHIQLNPYTEFYDLEKVAELLITDTEQHPEESIKLSPFSSSLSKEAFEDSVRVALSAIHAGEAKQIVVSRKVTANITGDTIALYEKLRRQNPSPYMYYMEFDDHVVIGTSPESVVSVQQGYVTVNPIAGTRPRGKTREEDELFEQLLRKDPKEQMEHEMLVEESKQELAKFCVHDSIRVTASQETVRYEHVMHLVSKVEGLLLPGKHAIDALQVCLPAGTVTGSPKKEAMRFIREIEKEPRGIYGGAVGYMSLNGNLDMALTIRTMVIQNGKVSVQAGAGIVSASNPESEYFETEYKLKSLTTLGQ